jgi:outer membrane protein, adhesin transport system
MNSIKKIHFLGLICYMWLLPLSHAQTISLQTLLDRLSTNNELIKSGQSQVQARKAEVKEASFNRLPSLNTIYQGTIGTDNNVPGPYLSMGILPSVTGGTRAYSNTSAVGGNTALAGVNWEAINFGEYKAQTDLAKAGLQTQNSLLVKTQYDLNGIAAAYYIELLRQNELAQINQENVSRLRQLLSTVSNLIINGIRPGVDSAIASAELSKSIVSLYDAQKLLAQTQSQLSALTAIPMASIVADTISEEKLISTGPAFVLSTAIDTAGHPDIALYSSLLNQSKARLNLENKRFYPKVYFDADAWTRGSSLSSADHYGNIGDGFAPQRFDYFIGLTLTYDIMNIAHKRLSSAVSRYESEASAHQLEQAKIDINNSYQQTLIENDYERKRLIETDHQLRSAAQAYEQQANLYRNGLSSIIDIDIALSYYIQARKD